MAGGVGRFLVTTSTDLKMAFWAATGAFSNWLEGRAQYGNDYETWLVTVFKEDEAAFLDAARHVGVTVEEIEGAGDTETYLLRVGEPGSGWRPVRELG
jgi:hypothetical protein